MTLVRDRMTSAPTIVGADATLAEIVAIFGKASVSAVPVVSAGRLVGVVSTTDIVRSLPDGAEPSKKAAEVMSVPPVVARPDEPLDDAVRRLVEARVHRLVVIERDQPVGILAARDLLEEVRARRIAAPIRSIMTTPVETVGIGDSIAEVTRRLAATNVHGLIVVDEASPVGVYTHREALAARSLPPALGERPVEEVMSYETICLNVETPIFRAAAYGTAMDVRRFLVVEHRRLVGIVSALDLVGAL